jgi:hypothetical protein
MNLAERTVQVYDKEKTKINGGENDEGHFIAGASED